MSLLDQIKTQANITGSVLVSFSMGKDSIAVMDLCFKYFKHVQPFFMYMVPGLKFQEEALAKYEHHYKKGNLKHITYYGKNGHRIKQIDLFGPAHTVNGKKVPTPHTHLGYMHLEGGTRNKLTDSERKMVENVNRLWKNRN